MYSLGIRREFSARHYLIRGDWGAENIEHPHRYRMELVLESATLDRHGFLVDIIELEEHLETVITAFAGQTLNEMAALAGLNPSLERLATVLHDAFRSRLAHCGLAALTVTLWEDSIAWASYRAPF